MNVEQTTTWLGPFFALLSSLTWAIGSSVYARQAGRVGALEVNLTRALCATPMFLVSALVFFGPGSLFTIPARQVGWLSLSVACSYVVGDTLFYLAALRLGTPTALAIASSYPVWSALFGALFLHETLGALRMVGTLLCVAGIIWLVLLQTRNEASTASERAVFPTTRSTKILGVVLALLTSLCWAGNTYSLRQGGENLPLFVVNSYRYLLASLVLGVAWLKTHKYRPVGGQLLRSPKALLGFLPAVLLEAFFGSSIFVYAITHTDLSISAPLTSLAPLFSVPIGVLLKTEPLCARRLAAIVLTVGGIVCLVMG
ncbi:MAG TPA: DMT family transporter [Pseudomonadota bacterium]|nr:DMT family transporter [Pseudomonadota bacterium]